MSTQVITAAPALGHPDALPEPPAGVQWRVDQPHALPGDLEDEAAPPEDAHRTYEQAGGAKRWVCYPEGNHVCNNIIYKYRPLVADFMAEHLS